MNTEPGGTLSSVSRRQFLRRVSAGVALAASAATWPDGLAGQAGDGRRLAGAEEAADHDEAESFHD